MGRFRTKGTRRFQFDQLESRVVLSNVFVSPTGSDAAAGTATAPWKTLQHAADVVKAGDLVDVKAGTYSGFVLRSSGTASSPITFKAEPGVTINTPTSYSGDDIYLYGASFVTVQGFTVTGATHAGISSRLNHDATIVNNVADNNAIWGIYTSHSDRVVIDHNVTSRSHQQHGIYVANATVSPVITNNIVWGNSNCGIQMNGDAGQGGTGLITGATVTGNIIYNNGKTGGSAINADGVQNSVFQNNLLYNNHANGLSLFHGDGAAGSSNNCVINNTIINASDGRSSLNIQGGSTGNTVYNNILLNNSTYYAALNVSTDSLSGFKSDYNAVTSRFTADSGNSFINLAGWQKLTGQDAHSFVATSAQLFLAPASNNYSLSSTSPAIDAGLTSVAPTVDIQGRTRVSVFDLRVDIGAYEYPKGLSGWPTTMSGA